MPTARYGDCRSQAFIALWVGARHWSKPNPWKAPGVATLAVTESAGPVGPTAATMVLPTRVSAAAASRGRSNIGSPGRSSASPWWGASAVAEIHGDSTP